jgi:hypothetical protein
MTAFERFKPVATRTSQITVDGLAPGRYRFTLVVRDDAGNASVPSTAEVTVLEGRVPPQRIVLRDVAPQRPVLVPRPPIR